MTRKNSIMGMIVVSVFMALFTTVAVSAPAQAAPKGKVSAKAIVAKEKDMVKRVNAFRVSQGLSPAKASACLNREARKQAKVQARKRKMAHSEILNTVVKCKIGNASENVAYSLKTTSKVVYAWTRSSGHRANMLGGNWDLVGAGVAYDRKGVPYYTLLMGESKKPFIPTLPPETIPPTEVPVDPEVDPVDNPPANPEVLEAEVFELTNTARAAAGKGTLTESDCLNRYADAQARAQAEDRAMYHQEILYIVVDCNMPLVGENVAYGFSEAETVQEAWMNSPGHRANILANDWTQVAVGVAVDANGLVYYSVVFGQPRT